MIRQYIIDDEVPGEFDFAIAVPCSGVPRGSLAETVSAAVCQMSLRAMRVCTMRGKNLRSVAPTQYVIILKTAS